MESITLAAYLEKNPGNKRLNKRIARALKTYLHSLNDLTHAASDIAHAKEDCAFALQAADQIIEDCHSLLEEWALPDEIEVVETESQPEPGDCTDEECADCDGECDGDDESEYNAAEEVEDHLRHAAKDIGHALEDAESALAGLDKVEGLLFDIIEMAEEDGFAIHPSEARAYLLQKAKDAGDAKPESLSEGDGSTQP